MVLTIVQWNTRRLIANGLKFKKFIDNKDKKPHMYTRNLVNASTFTKNSLFYKTRKCCKEKLRNRKSGGGAIFILNQLQ